MIVFESSILKFTLGRKKFAYLLPVLKYLISVAYFNFMNYIGCGSEWVCMLVVF